MQLGFISGDYLPSFATLALYKCGPAAAGSAGVGQDPCRPPPPEHRQERSAPLPALSGLNQSRPRAPEPVQTPLSPARDRPTPHGTDRTLPRQRNTVSDSS